MSAFMCDAEHLSAVADTLVALAGEPHASVKLDAEETAEFLFKMLLVENATSLEARYPSNWHELIPDGSLFGMVYTPQLRGASFGTYPYDADRLACSLKAISCYAYQACEHDGWEASRTYALVTAAKAELAIRLAYCHPAYDAAEWGWRPALTAAPVRRR